MDHICYCNGNGSGNTTNLKNIKWFKRPTPHFNGTLVSSEKF